jgi:nitrate reductase NapE component
MGMIRINHRKNQNKRPDGIYKSTSAQFAKNRRSMNGRDVRFKFTFLILGIFCIADFAISGRYGFGYNIFDFLTTGGRFDDYYNNLIANDGFAGQRYAYHQIYPLGVLLARTLMTLPKQIGLLVYLCLLCAGFVTGMRLLGISKRTTIVLLFSYPVIFNVFRGNNELLLFLGVSVAICVRNKLKNQDLSQFVLVLTMFIEPWPYAILLIGGSIKRYIVFARSIFVVSLCGLLLSINNFQWYSYFKTNILSAVLYTQGGNGFSFIHHHSISAGTMMVIKLTTGNYPDQSGIVLRVAMSVMVVLGLGFTAWIALSKLMCQLNRLILVFSSACLFISVSADYRLVYLLLPLGFLLDKEVLSPTEMKQLVLLVIVVIPKHFVWLGGFPPNEPGGTSNGLLTCFALMALYCLTIVDIYKSKFNGELITAHRVDITF